MVSRRPCRSVEGGRISRGSCSRSSSEWKGDGNEGVEGYVSDRLKRCVGLSLKTSAHPAYVAEIPIVDDCAVEGFFVGQDGLVGLF